MLKIGIFDNDADGQKAFQLDRNFTAFLDKSWVKAHANGRAFALLLPPIPQKQELIEAQNFPIEFMFDEKFIKLEEKGHSLELIPQSITLQCNGIKVKSFLADELRFMKIVGNSKLGFAQHVVPSLPPEAFQHFKALFEQIMEIIASATCENRAEALPSSTAKGKAKLPTQKNDRKVIDADTHLVMDAEDTLEIEYQNQLAQSVYLLNCNPHPIVDAYSYALQVKASIPEMQKRFGDKNVSVLMRLHLLDYQGQPKIPLWSDSSDPKIIVQGAAARHEVLEFVRPLIRADPLLSPKSIGNAVANKFGIGSWTENPSTKSVDLCAVGFFGLKRREEVQLHR